VFYVATAFSAHHTGTLWDPFVGLTQKYQYVNVGEPHSWLTSIVLGDAG